VKDIYEGMSRESTPLATMGISEYVPLVESAFEKFQEGSSELHSQIPNGLYNIIKPSFNIQF